MVAKYITHNPHADDWESSDSGTNETNTPGSLACDVWLPNGVKGVGLYIIIRSVV